MESTLLAKPVEIGEAASGLHRNDSLAYFESIRDRSMFQRPLSEVLGLRKPYSSEIASALSALGTMQLGHEVSEQSVLNAQKYALTARDLLAIDLGCFPLMQLLDTNTWRTIQAEKNLVNVGETADQEYLGSEFEALLQTVPQRSEGSLMLGSDRFYLTGELTSLCKAVRHLDLASASNDSASRRRHAFDASLRLRS